MSSTPHVMVDLETFGSTPGSAIASIGAVAFNPRTGEIGERFYAVVDPATCQREGMTIDADTMLWWLKQSDGARAALAINPKLTIYTALAEFSAFWERVGGTHFWGHGANFDDPLLNAAYRATRSPPPWKFFNSRCTRTLFDLSGVKPDRAEGTHHNALDDALAQAKAVVAAYSVLFPPLAKVTPRDGLAAMVAATARDMTEAHEALERLGDGDRYIPACDHRERALHGLVQQGLAGVDEEGFFLTPSGRTHSERAAIEPAVQRAA